jgi:hypothetical protein
MAPVACRLARQAADGWLEERASPARRVHRRRKVAGVQGHNAKVFAFDLVVSLRR